MNENNELVILMGIIIACCAFILLALCYPPPSATLQNTGNANDIPGVSAADYFYVSLDKIIRRDAFAPDSIRDDEIVRPERPKRERGQGGLPPQSSASRLEGSVIEAVRLA